MWRDAVIHVVVPAYREARLLPRMLTRIPSYVDRIVVVDDGSDDETVAAAEALGDPRVEVLKHPENRGVGAAIVTGYRRAFELGAQVIAVMAGDDQMHPDDLRAVIEPVVRGQADYVKGNRLVHPSARDMPWQRRVAGRALAFATRCATGLDVGDTQCGFTALGARGSALPLHELWPRYGYPNDLLGMIAAHGLRVREVPVRPVYADETSGVRPWHALTVLGVIVRRWKRERRWSPSRNRRS